MAAACGRCRRRPAEAASRGGRRRAADQGQFRLQRRAGPHLGDGHHPLRSAVQSDDRARRSRKTRRLYLPGRCKAQSFGARIVADGFAFTNEARIDRAVAEIYVVETPGRRITRFRFAARGRIVAARNIHAIRARHLRRRHRLRRRRSPLGDQRGQQSAVSALRRTAARPCWFSRTASPISSMRMERASAPARSRASISIASRPAIQNIASVAFGGPDLRTIYLGSLSGDTSRPSARRSLACAAALEYAH